jgi:hypothetical protein
MQRGCQHTGQGDVTMQFVETTKLATCAGLIVTAGLGYVVAASAAGYTTEAITPAGNAAADSPTLPAGRQVAPLPTCGNGRVDAGEVCDGDTPTRQRHCRKDCQGYICRGKLLVAESEWGISDLKYRNYRRVSPAWIRDCVEVQGALQLYGSPYEDLSIFARLESVELDLTVFNNKELETLRGLHNLRRVGMQLTLTVSPKLESLEGLDRLEEVEEELFIGLSELRTLAGMPRLERVGVLSVAHSHHLEGLDSFTRAFAITRGLSIVSCQRLKSLEAIEDLELQDGALILVVNAPRLTGLQGLEGLTTTGGVLVWENAILHDLSALRSVKAIHGGLIIDENPRIRDLGSLQQVKEIRGRLAINDNATLADISALFGVEVYGGFTADVVDNPRLPQCQAEHLVTHLRGLQTEESHPFVRAVRRASGNDFDAKCDDLP